MIDIVMRATIPASATLATVQQVQVRVDALVDALVGLGVSAGWEMAMAAGLELLGGRPAPGANGHAGPQAAQAAQAAPAPAQPEAPVRSAKGNRYRSLRDDSVLRAEVLAEMVRLAKGGVAPTQVEWDMAQKDPEREDALPTAAAVTQRLGSWARLAELAGLTPGARAYRQAWGEKRKAKREKQREKGASGGDDAPEGEFRGGDGESDGSEDLDDLDGEWGARVG